MGLTCGAAFVGAGELPGGVLASLALGGLLLDVVLVALHDALRALRARDAEGALDGHRRGGGLWLLQIGRGGARGEKIIVRGEGIEFHLRLGAVAIGDAVSSAIVVLRRDLEFEREIEPVVRVGHEWRGGGTVCAVVRRSVRVSRGDPVLRKRRREVAYERCVGDRRERRPVGVFRDHRGRR